MEIKPFRVLLIGNSYSPHGLASRLQQELTKRTEKPFEVQTMSGDGQTVMECVPKLEAYIQPPPDIVLLQEQSQIPAFAEVEYLMKLQFYNGITELVKPLLAANKWCRIILFQTWARHPKCFGPDSPEQLSEQTGKSHEEMHDRLVRWYHRAANEVILPESQKKPLEIARVGEAWEAYIEEHNDMDALYNVDGSHPSEAGLELTMNVIANTILGGMPCCKESNVKYCVRQAPNPLRPMPELAEMGGR